MEAVKSNQAPLAIGPYSQAVLAGDYLFVSGQLPLSLISGKIEGENIEEQTQLVLSHIEAILKVKSLSLKNVVKVEVYLKDMHDFDKMNQVYTAKFLQEIKPARQAMQVARLPKDALIEISCIAYLKESS